MLEAALQDVILASSKEVDPSSRAEGRTIGYHCFSLGLHADIAAEEMAQGQTPDPASFALRPGNWDALAERFLKSLPDNSKRVWIERLALTPRFEETAARTAWSAVEDAAQSAAWESLLDYSFVVSLSEPGWYTLRPQMRKALMKQITRSVPEATREHTWWRQHWQARSTSETDEFASLAWFHWFRVAPEEAQQEWKRLAEGARGKPMRMALHYRLLNWWLPTEIMEASPIDVEQASARYSLGSELIEATLGARVANLRQAIACYEAALRIRTEDDFPQDWAMTQNNLGIAYTDLPSGDRAANLRQAIACYEAALRIRTEADFPQDWAMTKNNLGIAYKDLPSGDRAANLRQAIACYEAALRIYTESDFPQAWAIIQNNLGNAYKDLPSGDRAANLRRRRSLAMKRRSASTPKAISRRRGRSSRTTWGMRTRTRETWPPPERRFPMQPAVSLQLAMPTMLVTQKREQRRSMNLRRADVQRQGYQVLQKRGRVHA